MELIRWELAERFGWTLEYIGSLSMVDLQELMQVDDGRVKARPKTGPGSSPRKRIRGR